MGQANILATGGNIKTEEEDYLDPGENRSYHGDELNNVVPRCNMSGNTIRLKDVAEIRDRFSETPNASYFNGNLAVNIEVSNTNSEDLYCPS